MDSGARRPSGRRDACPSTVPFMERADSFSRRFWSNRAGARPHRERKTGRFAPAMKSRLRRCAGENRLKCAENLRPGPAEGPRHVLSWRPSALCRPDQALCVACGSSNERQSGNACSPELSKSVNGDWRLQGLGPSRRVHFSIPRRGLCSNWSSCAPRGESWIPQNPLTRKIESRTHAPQQFKGNYH